MQINLATRALSAACALQHTALTTEKSYAHWVRHYAAFLKVPRSEPLGSTEAKMEAFLTSLALQGVSASTQNQAFCALLFFKRKYPYAEYAERWGWLFPSRSLCRDPRRNKLVRWRCHESNVQRAVRAAADRCGLRGLTPHHLRHGFATHALQDGAFVRDLQVVLGHTNLETTMNYLHAEAGRVTSPLREFAASPAPRFHVG